MRPASNEAVIRIVTLLFCATLLTGCGTQPKIYKAPNDAKVKAATVDLNVKVKKARETAARAKKAAEEARAISDRLVRRAGTLKELLDKLAVRIPDEYKGPLREVSDNVDALIGENAELQEKLKELTGWNFQLQSQLSDAEAARVTLQKAVYEYASMAMTLAQDATDERNYRIKAESQLLKQKIFGLLWKIGGGAVVALIIALVVLWFTGKLAFKFAK